MHGRLSERLHGSSPEGRYQTLSSSFSSCCIKKQLYSNLRVIFDADRFYSSSVATNLPEIKIGLNNPYFRSYWLSIDRNIDDQSTFEQHLECWRNVVNNTTSVCDCYLLATLGWNSSFHAVEGQKLWAFFVDNLKNWQTTAHVFYLECFCLLFWHNNASKINAILFDQTARVTNTRVWTCLQSYIIPIVYFYQYSFLKLIASLSRLSSFSTYYLTGLNHSKIFLVFYQWNFDLLTWFNLSLSRSYFESFIWLTNVEASWCISFIFQRKIVT